jgi:hypothetical protein
MSQIVGFNELKIGQRVKVKGQAIEGGNFTALAVVAKPEEEDVSLEGKLQGVDVQRNTLRIMHRDFAVGGNALIKNLARQDVGLQDLKTGDVIKVKGKYAPASGFVPLKIKVQEPKGFAIDELQGAINKIDREANTIEVIGLTIALNEKTEIDGI